MVRAVAVILLGLSTSACGYNYTPPDTSGGYSSEKLLRVFGRECVEERMSQAREAAERNRGLGCLGDEDCERDARGRYVWKPLDAPELEVSMKSDSWMLSEVRGDGWHCSLRFWRRPDDQVLARLSQLAGREGLTRYETWSQGEGHDHIVWHVWRPEDADIPELRLIQQERPAPWTLLYVD